MVKLIALVIIGYLIYRWIKGKPGQGGSKRSTGNGRPVSGELGDEMIQDPQCGAYFPRSTGVSARVDGQRMLFCSEKCRDEYLARYKAK